MLRGDWVKDQVTREPAGRIGRETESEREAKKGRMDREQMTVVTLTTTAPTLLISLSPVCADGADRYNPTNRIDGVQYSAHLF